MRPSYSFHGSSRECNLTSCAPRPYGNLHILFLEWLLLLVQQVALNFVDPFHLALLFADAFVLSALVFHDALSCSVTFVKVSFRSCG